MRQLISPLAPSAPKGLRRRLLLALLLPLVLILITSSIFDYRLARQTADSSHDQSLADTVYDLESHIRNRLIPGPLDLAEEAEAMLRSSTPDLVYFAIRDSTGKTLAGDDDLPALSPPKDNQLMFLDSVHKGAPVRIALLQLNHDFADIHIVVAETNKKREFSRQRILTAMVLPNLAVIVATLLAVLFGVRHGLLPLQTIEREIAARSANDLHEFDLGSAPSEIRPMLRRLNELFALLRESAAVQQRFIADAAHQLRTPLAGLQTQLDLAAGEGAFNHNAERLAHIEEATTRIGHLLSQLLSYARAESSSSISASFESVAIDQVVEKSASTFLDAALAKNIDLGFEIESATTRGLSWMLQEALGNLIDNAVRYTPEGGIINVRCGQAGDSAYLEVEDSGPGIAQEHMGQVYERFYRIPGSPGNGCGLGLSIVQEIAGLHGASVLLGRSELGGLKARLQFPQGEP